MKSVSGKLAQKLADGTKVTWTELDTKTALK